MESSAAINALQSLAQETRLAIFRLLVKAGPEGMTAGDIADTLDVPAPTLSFHLSQLTQAGLVGRRRESRSLWYHVRFDQTRRFLDFLLEDCCQGNPALCCRPATTEACHEC